MVHWTRRVWQREAWSSKAMTVELGLKDMGRQSDGEWVLETWSAQWVCSLGKKKEWVYVGESVLCSLRQILSSQRWGVLTTKSGSYEKWCAVLETPKYLNHTSYILIRTFLFVYTYHFKSLRYHLPLHRMNFVWFKLHIS